MEYWHFIHYRSDNLCSEFKFQNGRPGSRGREGEEYILDRWANRARWGWGWVLISWWINLKIYIVYYIPGTVIGRLSVCLLTQSCLTLFDPMDYNLPGSSAHGILQARILEWVAISYSRGSSWPREPALPALAGRFFTSEPPEKPIIEEMSKTFRVQGGHQCKCPLRSTKLI